MSRCCASPRASPTEDRRPQRPEDQAAAAKDIYATGLHYVLPVVVLVWFADGRPAVARPLGLLGRGADDRSSSSRSAR
jgi:hypothetical protein